jgi:hypothetical protein
MKADALVLLLMLASVTSAAIDGKIKDMDLYLSLGGNFGRSW